jgi:lysophospholipase L1-like esterase
LLISLLVGAFIGTGKVMTASASLTDDYVPSASSIAAVSSVSSSPTNTASAASSQSSTASKAAQQTPSEGKASAVMGQLPNALAQEKTERNILGSVNENYFSDALFVGDSLTEGLKEYGHLDSASYFYRVGLSIYQLFEYPKEDAQSGLTFEEMLKQRKYGKIYFLLGINEIGTGTDDYFARHYSAILEKVHDLQPDAIIYIQSILPVTAEKSSGGVFTNERIRARNLKLEKLADGKNIFFLNVSSGFCDKDGCMPEQYSGDGVHIKAKHYSIWKNYLLTHAVSG